MDAWRNICLTFIALEGYFFILQMISLQSKISQLGLKVQQVYDILRIGIIGP